MTFRTVILLVLVLAARAGAAQDLREVQRSMAADNWQAAREQVDRYLENTQNREEAGAWFYRGKIYTALSKKASSPDKLSLQKEALRSFRTYQGLDSLNAMMELDHNAALFQIYDASYNEGILQYNNKNYEGALTYFRNALETKDYIFGKGFSLNGFSFPALDTQLVNLAAHSAWHANKEDEAVSYLEKLAGAGLRSAEYRQVYGLLAEYYCRGGNTEKYGRFLSLGKELYPRKTAYWSFVEGKCLSGEIYLLEQGSEAGKEQLAGKYQQLHDLAFKAYETYTKQTSLDAADKEAFRGVIHQLAAYHEWKKEPEKAANYKSKLKGL
jgi:hypothetical protein